MSNGTTACCLDSLQLLGEKTEVKKLPLGLVGRDFFLDAVLILSQHSLPTTPSCTTALLCSCVHGVRNGQIP